MKDKLGYITKLQERIKKAKDMQRIPSKAAKDEVISWEDFFMSIAKLSKTRPGEYDHNSKKSVKCIVRGISINRSCVPGYYCITQYFSFFSKEHA